MLKSKNLFQRVWLILIFFLISVICSAQRQSDSSEVIRRGIETDVLADMNYFSFHPFQPDVNLTYEHPVKQSDFSYGLGMAYGYKLYPAEYDVPPLTGTYREKGLTLKAEARWYPFLRHRSVEGFYTGLYSQLMFLRKEYIVYEIDRNNDPADIRVVNTRQGQMAGLCYFLGYKLFCRHYWMDFTIGLPALTSTGLRVDARERDIETVIRPDRFAFVRMEVCMGYAW